MGALVVMGGLAVAAFTIVAILDRAEQRERERAGKKLVTNIEAARQKKSVTKR